jgi:hypothetical protein
VRVRNKFRAGHAQLVADGGCPSLGNSHKITSSLKFTASLNCKSPLS